MASSRRRRPSGSAPVQARVERAFSDDRVEAPVLDLEVERMAHGGVAVAHHDGRVVFVADAIPGERVRARITDVGKSSFWRAETLEVLEASPDRRDHVWAEASVDRDPAVRAGGAEFGHIDMARQRALKAEVLRDSLHRFGGIPRSETDAAPSARTGGDVSAADAAAADAETALVDTLVVDAVDASFAPGVDTARGTGWRTRVRLHVDADGRVGPYAARSHTVVPVESLPLAAAELEELAELGRRRQGIAAIDLVAPSAGAAFAAIVEPERRARRERSGGPGGGRGGDRTRSRGNGRDDRRGPDGDRARTTIQEQVGERRFTLDRGGFWQVHRGAAATLSAAVQELIDAELFDPRAANHDLYGGVGLLAAAVGDRFGAATSITTVEADARATEHAGENLAEWVGARAITARVDRYLDGLASGASAAELRSLRDATIVLDPPRAGAGRQVVDRLAELAPRQLVYVACDPVALARDVGLLRERGYRLDAIRAVDLFPNTHHVEAVARLSAIV